MALQPTRANRGVSHGFLSGGPLKPFSYPRFRLYWAASLASVMPFWMGMAARGWLVLVLTESPFMVTAAQGVMMLPMAVLTPFGGVIADRLNRKMVLLATDAANLLFLVVMTLLLFLHLVQEWHVFVLAFLTGTVFSISMPTRAIAVHDVVGQGDVAKGVALYTTVFSITQLAGPALAGYLMNSRPDQLGWTFLAASAFIVPAIAFLLLLRFPDKAAVQEGAGGPSVMRSIAEGLSHVRASSLLVGLVLMIVVFAVFGIPYQTLLPVFARDILDTGPDGLGLLLAAGGGGGHPRVRYRGIIQHLKAIAGPHPWHSIRVRTGDNLVRFIPVLLDVSGVGPVHRTDDSGIRSQHVRPVPGGIARPPPR